MEALTFSIFVGQSQGVSKFAPTCSMPSLTAYQAQKKIQVVSTSQLNFGNEISQGEQENLAGQTQASALFYQLRLEAALAAGASAVNSQNVPSYFPGPIIPGPGGPHCHEVNRGNLLFDQFQNLVAFDSKTIARLERIGKAVAQTVDTDLFTSPAEVKEPWAWTGISAPTLSFLHQTVVTGVDEEAKLDADRAVGALSAFKEHVQGLYQKARHNNFAQADSVAMLNTIGTAWHHSITFDAPQDAEPLAQALAFLQENHSGITNDNLLYVLFELEALISYKTMSAGLQTFAAGVFAGNFVEVALYPLGRLGATEFCVRERLFDEVINLVGRGFAPVVINEMGLVADGNHRVTASWIWNILKHTADKNLDWSMDCPEFQKATAEYFEQSKESAVSRHEALSHLAYFLSRPEYRSKLNTYIRPLLAEYDYIKELPVVFLPEYLSQAVVKSHYDEGTKVERACPSVYETLAKNDKLVLPPRASYHFTDSALLPWFTVLGRDLQNSTLKGQNSNHASDQRFGNTHKNRLSARKIPTGVRNQNKKIVKRAVKPL